MRHDRIDTTGKITVRHNGRLHHIGIGRAHTRTPVIMLIGSEMGAPEAPLLLERTVRRAAIEAAMPLEEDLVASAQLPVDDLLDLLEAAVDDRSTIEL